MPTPKHQHNLWIREGAPNDAAWFFEIEEQTTWESLPPDAALNRDELREKLRATHGLLLSCPGNVFFIACDANNNDEKLGMLWFGPRHNAITGDHEGWIYNVTTLPQHRGCGVARSLISHAEEYARAQGYRVIGLAVATHNERARALYERLNFRQSNILMRKPLSATPTFP